MCSSVRWMAVLLLEWGLAVNKNEVQSLKGGFPIIENVDVVEWEVLDVVVE